MTDKLQAAIDEMTHFGELGEAIAEAKRLQKQVDKLKAKGDCESWWQARRKYLLAQARVWELCNR